MSLHFRRGLARALLAIALGAGQFALPAAADTALTVGKAQANADSIITVNVGDDAGIFKKHGLDLKILDFEGGSRLVQAMTAGSVDIGIGAGIQMAFVARGAPMLAVCEDTTTLPYFSIGVPYDSPIKSLDDLKGKKIGVSNAGALTDWVAQELARVKGWGPEGITRVMVGGSITASSAAFRAHQIDAYVGGTTTFLTEEKNKVGRVLAPVSDFIGNTASGTVFASSALMEKNPDALRAFLAAWIETTQFVLTHKDETVKSWAKATGFPDDIMSKEYDIVKGMYDKDCGFDPESVANLKRSFLDLKLLDTEPDMSKLYTEAYLPKTNK